MLVGLTGSLPYVKADFNCVWRWGLVGSWARIRIFLFESTQSPAIGLRDSSPQLVGHPVLGCRAGGGFAGNSHRDGQYFGWQGAFEPAVSLVCCFPSRVIVGWKPQSKPLASQLKHSNDPCGSAQTVTIICFLSVSVCQRIILTLRTHVSSRAN